MKNLYGTTADIVCTTAEIVCRKKSNFCLTSEPYIFCKVNDSFVARHEIHPNLAKEKKRGGGVKMCEIVDELTDIMITVSNSASP